MTFPWLSARGGKRCIVLCGALLLCPWHAYGKGFLDFNLYPYLDDVESDSVFTLNIGARLSERWSYFGFINFYNQPATAELSETNSYYTEQNLRRQLVAVPSLDLSVQHNMRTGEDNDRLRFGLRWRLNDSSWFRQLFVQLNLTYSLTLHALQIDDRDESVWQLEHSWRWSSPAVSERLYLAGFIDHTFNEDLPEGFPANPMVAELQLGWRLWQQWYAVAEYRLNQYRRQDVNNLALGVEYRVPF